jgi:hypothetical protein
MPPRDLERLVADLKTDFDAFERGLLRARAITLLQIDHLQRQALSNMKIIIKEDECP